MPKLSHLIASSALLCLSGQLLAQPLLVTSQRFTFRVPGQADEVLTPSTQGLFERTGSLTQGLAGSFGGEGTLQTDGVARATTSWTANSLAWSSNALLQNTILDPFEVDDYSPIGLRAQVITEVRFQLLDALEVQLTRTGTALTNSHPDFLNDLTAPVLFPLDSLGEPITSQAIPIGTNDPTRILQAGSYLVRVRAAAIVVTSFGNAPVAGSSNTIDGAILTIIPAPAPVGTLLGLLGATIARRVRK